jgi:type IV pilus assembly protein PilV
MRGLHRTRESLKYAARQKGFSLLEAMIAFAVISIGLLGIAKMQAVSINSTKNSNSRSIAALESASIASAMFANQSYWRNGTPPATLTVNKAVISDATLSANTQDCAAGLCTPSQLASFDLRDWGTTLAALLPAGTGQINCAQPAGGPVSCNVQILWQEKLVASNKATVAASNAPTTLTFALLVEP